MANETIAVIRRRRSIRDFRPEQLKEEEIREIVQAGLYAPNAGDEAWHFTVIQNAGILTRMETLSRQAAAASPLPWLKQLGEDEKFHPLYGAPALILVSCPEGVTAVYDASAATENILLAAESLDIGSCWGYFITQAFDAPEGGALAGQLQIPEGYKVLTSVALGYKKAGTPAAPARKPGLVTYIE